MFFHGLLGYFVAAPQRRGLHTRVHESLLARRSVGRLSPTPEGPAPVRNMDFPEGFSWLTGHAKLKAETGTALIRRALELAEAAHKRGIPWLIEHPEFLGTAQRGTPASIWATMGVTGWPYLDRETALPRATSQALARAAGLIGL